MSIFRDYNFGYNPYRDGFRSDAAAQEERFRELRKKANDNLQKCFDGTHKRAAAARVKRSELETASAEEIQLGFIVLDRREQSKQLNRLLRRKKALTDEEVSWAEELQSQVDHYDTVLEPYTRQKLTRFIRLWNKSQKRLGK